MESENSQVASDPFVASGDAAELLASLQRERADFTNYRRRIAAERAHDRDRARAGMLTELLPLLDDLDWALTHIPTDLTDHPWVRGTTLAHRHLVEALDRFGIERFGAAGDLFDPTVHEAIVFEPRAEATDRRVDSVISPGYRLGPQLIRPAQVVVVGPADAASTAPDLGAEPAH